MGLFGRVFIRLLRRFAWAEFADAVLEIQSTRFRTFGDRSRLSIHPTSQVNDALFNTNSGSISVGEHAFFGHGVSILTGRHDPLKYGVERKGYPKSGCDVVIEDGVWIGSNATILGPCKIGRNAVIAAMSLVRADVEAFSIVAGVPAKVVKMLPPASPGTSGAPATHP